MADPTIEQLSESVTTAGADWGAEIVRGPLGRLQIIRRHGELLYADRKSTRLNSSHIQKSRMPSSA